MHEAQNSAGAAGFCAHTWFLLSRSPHKLPVLWQTTWIVVHGTLQTGLKLIFVTFLPLQFLESVEVLALRSLQSTSTKNKVMIQIPIRALGCLICLDPAVDFRKRSPHAIAMEILTPRQFMISAPQKKSIPTGRQRILLSGFRVEASQRSCWLFSAFAQWA